MKKIIVLLVLFAAIAAFYMWRQCPTRTPQVETVTVPKTGTVPFGINIGYWLSDEFGLSGTNRAFETLRSRFGIGIDEADRILDVYHREFVTASDFAAIQAFGFKSVRVPVSAEQLLDAGRQSVRFERIAGHLDRLFAFAAENGISVVLNISACPGLWTLHAPAPGRSPAARWSARDIGTMTELWSRLAARFGNQAALAGYDLSPGSCAEDLPGDEAFFTWAQAILAADGAHDVYAPWRRDSQAKLREDARFAGHQLGFSADLVDGFSDTSAPGAADPVTERLQRMLGYWSEAGISGIVSAITFPVAGDASANRKELIELAGWPAYGWSLKGPKEGPLAGSSLFAVNWTDIDATLTSDGAEEIFAATMAITNLVEVSDAAATAWRVKAAKGGAEISAGGSDDGAVAPPEPWVFHVVGSVDGRVAAVDDAGVTIASTGVGPAHAVPGFSFLYRAAGESFDLHTQVEWVGSPRRFAGAGIIIRQSLDASSPYMMVYRAADGSARAVLSAHGSRPAVYRKIKNSESAKYLRVVAEGGFILKASCSVDGSAWPVAENFSVPWMTNGAEAGCFVFSGDEYLSSIATFANMSLTEPLP